MENLPKSTHNYNSESDLSYKTDFIIHHAGGKIKNDLIVSLTHSAESFWNYHLELFLDTEFFIQFVLLNGFIINETHEKKEVNKTYENLPIKYNKRYEKLFHD